MPNRERRTWQRDLAFANIRRTRLQLMSSCALPTRPAGDPIHRESLWCDGTRANQRCGCDHPAAIFVSVRFRRLLLDSRDKERGLVCVIAVTLTALTVAGKIARKGR